MNIVCVIRRGQHLSYTLSSILFDKHGRQTSYPYVLCDSWQQGFIEVKNKYQYALFVDSGTIFYDLESFIEDLKNYPHQGLVGHIVDPKDTNSYYHLHQQCFFLKLDQYSEDDLEESSDTIAVAAVRSEKNIHDDYTPLWLKGTNNTASYKFVNFGSQLINQTLMQGKIAVNFSHQLRTKKKYLYSQESINEWLDHNQEYIELAKNQLWIFNNEPLDFVVNKPNVICPASGFFWLRASHSNLVQDIQVVDISAIQIKFARTILHDWNGNDYGGFVVDFMKDNNLKHFCLDRDLTKLERLQFTNKDKLRRYINEQVPKVDLDTARTKNITFYNQCILKFVSDTNITDSQLWMSNILNYKLTYLSYNYNFIEQFKLKFGDCTL